MRVTWAIVALTLLACDREPRVCEPLATTERGVPLETVMAAGKDAAGTFFVVTVGKSGYRAFSSEGGELWLRAATPGRNALSPAGGEGFVFRLGDELTLKVEILAGVVTMGVVRGPFAERDFAVGTQGETLEVVGAAVVAGMPMRERVEIVFEHLALTNDGRRLVVLRPQAASLEVEQPRLFFGPAERVLERTLRTMKRISYGDGTTILDFELDGQNAFATFPAPLLMMPATLTIGSEVLKLNPTPLEEATGEGLVFVCR